MACGTIAGLALGLGGAGVGEYANISTRNKMNDVATQALAKQQGFQKQASGVFDQSLSQSTPQAAQSQIGQGQQQLAGLIQNSQSVPLSASMPSFGATNAQTQQAKANMSNKAASDFGGYSNFGLQQQLKDLAAQSQLGVINNNAQGWANIVPYQMQQAQQSQSGLTALSQLLSTGGLLAGLSGLASAPAGAARGANALPGLWDTPGNIAYGIV